MTLRRPGPNVQAGSARSLEADRNGNTLAHAASGIRQLGQAAKLEKDDYFWIASCTKLVTAVAVLQLVEQGKVGLDDDASQYAVYLRNAKM